MRPYSLRIPAGGSETIGAVGTFFKVHASTGPVKISVPSRGVSGEFEAGEGLRGISFDALYIENEGSADVVLVLYAGAAEFIADRLAGTVNVDGVVETAPDYTRATEGRAYFRQADQQAVAAQTSVIQVENPAGSGKTLVITGLTTKSQTTGGYFFDSEPVTNYTETASLKAANCLLGGLASVANIRVGASTDSPPVVGRLSQFKGGAEDVITFPTPMVVPPGKTLVLWGAVANESLDVELGYFEV